MYVIPVPLGMRYFAAVMETWAFGIWILSVDLPEIPVCQHYLKCSYIEGTK